MLPVTYSDYNAAVDGITFSSSPEQSRRSKSRLTSKPSWLLLSISDMEDKIQALNVEYKPGTFGERADFYYRKRPELLALLQDLYNRYLYLADRYTRTLSKQQPKQHVQEQQHICHDTYLDQTKSLLSCQSPLRPQEHDATELVISELVLKFVDYQIVVDELRSLDMIQEESKKKIELHNSLLEVLESERVILSNENSRLASESSFMKRKAGELARRMLLEKTENERVFVLSRKINDLQAQILELKKRNKEYNDKLMKQKMNEGKKNISINIRSLMVKNNRGSGCSSDISWSGDDETGCSMSSTSNSSTCTSLAHVTKKKKKKYYSCERDGDKGYGLWDRMKKLDMFMCGKHLDATC
ncbi:hypothetical protein R6Q57_019723 [Mikania cordata]